MDVYLWPRVSCSLITTIIKQEKRFEKSKNTVKRMRWDLYDLFCVCPRGVMVKAMNCGIVVREFVRYYVHFRANTLGKGMNPLILPPAMGK